MCGQRNLTLSNGDMTKVDLKSLGDLQSSSKHCGSTKVDNRRADRLAVELGVLFNRMLYITMKLNVPDNTENANHCEDQVRRASSCSDASFGGGRDGSASRPIHISDNSIC